jgi:hypothetical protein
MTAVGHSDHERRVVIVAYERGYRLGAQQCTDWSNDRIGAALRTTAALIADIQLGGYQTEYIQGLADAFADILTQRRAAAGGA